MYKRETILDVIKHKTVEVGDCLEWTGYVTKDYGYPFTSLNGGGILVRRLVALRMGMDIKRFCITNTCGNKLCVAPEHIKMSTRKNVSMASLSKGLHSELSRQKTHIANRKKGKLTLDVANQIRAETGMSKRALGRKYGVTDDTISKVLNQETWKDMSSPFSYMAKVLA